MKVSLSVNDRVAFCRNLTESEAKEYSQVLKEAKVVTGQTGKSTGTDNPHKTSREG